MAQVRRIKRTSSIDNYRDADTSDSSNDDSAPESDESESSYELSIQSIIGVNESQKDKYYVKYMDRAYIHCEWLSEKEIVDMSGEKTLKRFKSRTADDDFVSFQSIPSLMISSYDDLNTKWFMVDRVFAFEDNQFLVKWKSLPYDQSTWEEEKDIQDKKAIEDFWERRKHGNRTVFGKKKERGTFEKLTESPVDKRGNTLRSYQLEGLNWLRFCWCSRRNSILADEMGLGKTVQIVSVLRDISMNRGIRGPFLVIAPMSTLGHWRNEIEHWSDLNVVVYHGSPATREIIEDHEFPVIQNGKRVPKKVLFDVLLTNYETFVTDFAKLKDIEWQYLALDEGHRLKNHAGKCYQLLQQLTYDHCTLLTGTPIQNNVEELWSLLHILHPAVFDDLAEFLGRFGEIDSTETLGELQELIKPYLLRRKKGDVETSIAAKEETIIEVELTRIQKTYYRALLHDNATTLMQQITGGALPSLLNLMMQLRKVCNHPFLLRDAEQSIVAQVASRMDPNADEDDVYVQALVDASGKMILLDKLLPKLKKDGHKVLIFSQMVKVLDIIEDYLVRKNTTYERIDGGVSDVDRQSAIDRFGSDSDIFVFLLCTRAGGVGINLTAADTVIIYDSDWNPQNDVQAQSRCHRIGQTSKVKVYRLVTRGTYELKMLDRASKKLGLDHALLDGGEISQKEPKRAKEIERLLRYGAYEITHDDNEIDEFCQADIEGILERRSTELTSESVSSSLFSKAKFDPEQGDTLDLNADDFWTHVLPEADIMGMAPMSPRRCRSSGRSIVDDSSLDSDSDSEQSSEQSTRRRSTVVSIRSLIRRMLASGLGDCPRERAILHLAATECAISDEDKAYISKLVGISDFDNPGEGFMSSLDEFQSNLNDVRDRKMSIVRRCILFSKLEVLLKRLQGEITMWPVSDAVDPMFDYAILFGVFHNGLNDSANIFEGVEGVEMPKMLSLKGVGKRLAVLVEALDQAAPPLTGAEVEIEQPLEWKKAHTSLYSRSKLTDEELQTLFTTVAALGLPKNGGEIDVSMIATYSRLPCVSVETIRLACNDIADFAAVDEDEPPPAIASRLGVYGGRQWQRKLRNSVRGIERIRKFMETFELKDEHCLSGIKPFESAEWWSTEHDIALLQSVSKFGRLLVSTWVADPKLPFREHIPPELLPEFQRAAEAESTRLKLCRPKDAGDLAFLYKDKLRVTRALAVIQFVESQKERPRAHRNVHKSRSQKKPPPPPLPSLPSLPSLPNLPLQISAHLILMSLGKFLSRDARYPVGYTVRCVFVSPVSPGEQEWFEVSISHGDRFCATMLSSPYIQFVGYDCNSCLQQIRASAQRTAELTRAGWWEPAHVDGHALCGFSNPRIYEWLDILRRGQSGVIQPIIPVLVPELLPPPPPPPVYTTVQTVASPATDLHVSPSLGLGALMNSRPRATAATATSRVVRTVVKP